MEICEDGHDQVCFDARNCPCCEVLKMNSDLDDKVFELNEEIDELKEEIKELKG
jgi:hypothetical protein